MKNKNWLTIVAFVVVLFGCDSEEVIPFQQNTLQSTKESQIKNVYHKGVEPIHNSVIKETDVLHQLAVSFSKDITEENLQLIQNQWLQVLKIWKQAELYNIGSVEDSFIHFEINRWPTNPELINQKIDGDQLINQELMDSSGSSSKGISALEYLLFNGDSSELIADFSSSDNRQLLYLVALTADLKLKAERLNQIWIDYEPQFLSSLSGGINDSQNQLANAMIGLLEEIVIKKIGNPLGSQSDIDNNLQLIEAHYSQNSLLIVQNHIIALEQCYFGSYMTSESEIGFDDYLVKLGQTNINSSISKQFDICKTKLSSMGPSLYQQIQDNPQSVEDLKTELTQLLALLKVDMASAINITLTIGDSDGD